MNCPLILLAAGLSAVVCGPSGVTFPKCDKDVIGSIETYWEGAGTPKCVLDLKGQYYAYKSTDGDIYKNSKCRIYEFVEGKKIKATVCVIIIIIIYGDGEEDTHEVKEKDGVLIAPTKNTYIISSDGGVIGTYSCSNADDAPVCDSTKAEVTIFKTKDANPDSLAHVQGVVKLLGFDLVKDYDCK